jgi:hypothetical protein
MRSARGVSYTQVETTLVAVIAIEPGMNTDIAVVTPDVRSECDHSKIIKLLGEDQATWSFFASPRRSCS